MIGAFEPGRSRDWERLGGTGGIPLIGQREGRYGNAMSFVKLHGSILDSSIWSQTDTIRLVWITMLAMANENGVVEASVDGLARRAVVSIEACEAALAALFGPDPRSRDGTAGERIEKVPGGWLVLNHGNYRERRTAEQIATARRVAEHRARKKAVTDNAPERYGALHLGDPKLSPSEAEADTDKNPPTPLRGKPPARPRLLRGVGDPAVALLGAELWLCEVVREWLAYRTEKRQKPYTPLGLKALVAKAREMGQSRARAAVQHSMAGDYQGLYEEKPRANGNGRPEPAPPPWLDDPKTRPEWAVTRDRIAAEERARFEKEKDIA